MSKWMNITSQVDDAMSAYNNLMDNGDYRVSDMWLMSSPVPVIVVCIVYVLSALLIGPKLMSNRKPFELKRAIAAYNFYQVIFNTWLFYESTALWCKYYGWGIGCLPMVPDNASERDIHWAAKVCHLYFINKITDFIDTLFFVLKKKQNKITVLHVFHHAIMPFSCWFGVKFNPGGNLSFFALPNLFVHIWMYTYYSLANMGPKYQKYIWWKRHLTELQLVQFMVIGVYMTYSSYVCKSNMVFFIWELILIVTFIFLFANFYRKSYKNKQSGTSNIGKEKKLEGKTQ